MSEEELTDVVQSSDAHVRSLHHLLSNPWEAENRVLHANNVQSTPALPVEVLHGDDHPPMTIKRGKPALVYNFSLDGVLRTMEVNFWISGGVVGFDYVVLVAWASDSESRTWKSLVQVKPHHIQSDDQTAFRVQAVFVSPAESSRHTFSVQVWDNFEHVPEDERVVAAHTFTVPKRPERGIIVRFLLLERFV